MGLDHLSKPALHHLRNIPCRTWCAALQMIMRYALLYLSTYESHIVALTKHELWHMNTCGTYLVGLRHQRKNLVVLRQLRCILCGTRTPLRNETLNCVTGPMVCVTKPGTAYRSRHNYHCPPLARYRGMQRTPTLGTHANTYEPAEPEPAVNTC